MRKIFHAGVLVSGIDVKGEGGLDGSKRVGLVVCKRCIKKHNEAGVMFDGCCCKEREKYAKNFCLLLQFTSQSFDFPLS